MHGHHGHGHHGHGWRWEGHGWKWAGGRHGGGGGRFGFGGRGKWDFGGRDPEDWMRAKRMLAQGDLRLIALALIAEAPRHGYEIIKLLEEKTGDWYSPSPGIIYPTLTYLEEAGYVTASAEGSKKLYTITEDGRAYLKANREIVDTVLDRLTALGERVNRWRQRVRGDRGERSSVPPLTEAALDHLRETIGKRLEDDAEAEAHLVEILARAAADIQRK
jgi:DNA-binding PadR family transcriptional regulator